MRRGLFAFALIAACSEEASAPPPAKLPPARVVECAAGHHALGAACVPDLAACGDGEVPLPAGGCRAVGVPADGCAAGFVHDGKGACDPVLPKSCAKGTFARPGESTCRAIDACGSERYPALASAAHVDASYTGTTEDGSVDRPFRTIGAALKQPDVKAIAIAAGRYVEDVVIDRAVRVAGVCAGKVEIVGSATGTDAAAVVVRAGTLEHVSISGASFGVIVDGAADAHVESVHVHDTATVGVWIRRGARATVLADSLVEGAPRSGIVVSGSTATIERSVVRGTRYADRTCSALQANPTAVDAPATVTVDHSVFEGSEGAGIAASGATIKLEGCVIRDIAPQPDGAWGIGAIAEVHAPSKLPGRIELTRSVIERTRYFGLAATSSSAALDRSVVRDVQPEARSGKIGRGVAAQVSGEVTVRDSTIARVHETGLDAVGGVKLSVERTLIRDVRAIAGIASGLAAVRSDRAPTVWLREVAIERPATAGIVASGELDGASIKIADAATLGVSLRGALATLSATRIERTGGNAVFARNDGELPTDLTLTDVVVDTARSAGVEFVGRTLNATGVWIFNVAPDDSGRGGVGVQVARRLSIDDPFAKLAHVAVERASGAGVFVAGARADLLSVVVRETRSLAGAFGDGLVVSGAAGPTREVLRSTVTVRDCELEGNARAGIAVFGSSVDVSGSRMICNAIALNTESVAATTPEGPIHADVTLTDSGNNVCGCESSSPCRAQTSGLAPIATATE